MRPKSRVSLGEACMILAAAICTAVMGGWFFGVEWLTDPPPDRVQMQFNTTVCGLALALSQLRVLRRQPWIRVFLVLALVLTLLNLLQYALDRDLGIDELFMTHPRDGRYSHPGRMAVNTSIMFLLASVLGLCDTFLKTKAAKRSLASLSTIVVALALLSLLGHLTAIKLAYGWSASSQMSIPTSLCGLFLGLGMTHTFLRSGELRDHTILPFAAIHIPVLGAAITIFLWFGLSALQVDESVARTTLFRHLILVGGITLSAGSAVLIASWIRTRDSEKRATRSLEELGRARAEVAQTNAQLDAVFATAVDSIIVIDDKGAILSANPATSSLFGWTADELEKMNIRDLMPSPQRENHDSYLKEYLNGRAARLVGTSRELVAVRADGRELPVLVSVGEMNLGGQKRFAGIVRDISELIRTQEKLERSNEELRQFAFAASHDMREPVRMIASYVELLERELKDSLNDQQKQFMHFARDGSIRMQEMITSLLEYAKAGRDFRFGATIELKDVVTEALQSQHMKIEETGATVEVLELPRVLGNHALLVRMTENLLSNAMKFVAAGEPPRIKISSHHVANGVAIDFEDQGIGITESKLTDIFKIFFRLHSREKYPGLGMGLALCMKIAKDHGGKLEAIRNEQVGTTIRFTLPAIRILSSNSSEPRDPQDLEGRTEEP